MVKKIKSRKYFKINLKSLANAWKILLKDEINLIADDFYYSSYNGDSEVFLYKNNLMINYIKIRHSNLDADTTSWIRVYDINHSDCFEFYKADGNQLYNFFLIENQANKEKEINSAIKIYLLYILPGLEVDDQKMAYLFWKNKLLTK